MLRLEPRTLEDLSEHWEHHFVGCVLFAPQEPLIDQVAAILLETKHSKHAFPKSLHLAVLPQLNSIQSKLTRLTESKALRWSQAGVS